MNQTKKLLLFFLSIGLFWSCSEDEVTSANLLDNQLALDSFDVSTRFQCGDKRFQAIIDNFKQEITQLEIQYNSQIDAATPASKVQNIGGVITFQDFNAFYDVSSVIERLDEEWDETYALKMETLVQTIFNGLGIQLPANPDLAAAARQRITDDIWDVIEDECVLISEEQASLSFEKKFKFRSMRQDLLEKEEIWLANGGYENNNTANPYFDVDYDVLRTFLTPDLQNPKIDVINPTLDVTKLDFYTGNVQSLGFIDKIKDLIDKIKPIIDIIGDIGNIGDFINIIGDIGDIFEDCSGSTEAKVRKMRDGYKIPNTDKMIGYVLAQNSRTIDFNSTQTKIKGKVKAFKKKRRKNKYKKDRRANVGIQYCAREWNKCDERPWPGDGGVYTSRVSSGKKKAKLKEYHGYALTIENSYDFLSYSLYHSGIERTTIPLLSNVTSSCNDPCPNNC